MDSITKKLKYIINKYNNKERICGEIDCNLMILELYEPEYYNKLKGNYSTIKQGIKLAKKTIGYRSIKEIMDKSGKYTEIPYNFCVAGDVGVVMNSNCTFLHLGKELFIIKDIKNKEIFKIIDKNSITHDMYKFYRRN